MIPLRDENPLRSFPLVTRSLVLINALVFLLAAAEGLESTAMEYGAVPVLITEPELAGQSTVEVDRKIRSIDTYGMQNTQRVSARVDLPRQSLPPLLTLLTSMFLHGGLFHLVGNMWFLWIFGDNVEDLLGRGRFLVFYLACGIAAVLAHVLLNPSSVVPVVGASGAISGLMGAYMRKFPLARVTTLIPLFLFFQIVRIPAFFFLGIWLLLQVVSIGSDAGIAWLAHIGGFLAGFLLIGWMSRRRPGRIPVR
ncbi:rhomboid family intramembrane serine protease [Candidatus Fermentibacterales bacterium]|nr:rhomboid family intramembrane serine protease [Candidatus Fermentibacterales bacterium]